MMEFSIYLIKISMINLESQTGLKSIKDMESLFKKFQLLMLLEIEFIQQAFNIQELP